MKELSLCIKGLLRNHHQKYFLRNNHKEEFFEESSLRISFGEYLYQYFILTNENFVASHKEAVTTYLSTKDSFKYLFKASSENSLEDSHEVSSRRSSKKLDEE